MSEICVFAGTTEGRRLVEFLTGQPVKVLACVATDYGEALIPPAENVEISAGRLDQARMEALFTARRFNMVVDATHPYATRVSEQLSAACERTSTPYLRLNRESTPSGEDAIHVDSIEEAADYLARHPGIALIATGGKALEPYTAVEGYRERFYVRVLPMSASVRACEDAGFAPSHIIAMQGPFSVEMNAATLKSVCADYLVTKDSGASGGLPEKLEAARQAGARCIVVGRPGQASGLDFNGTIALLMKQFGLCDVRWIDVVGIGMGAIGSMTFEADAALRACDGVIGARRMLEASRRYGKPEEEAVAPEKIVEILRSRPKWRRVAVVLSGDTGFYSGAKRLLPLLKGHKVRVIPGISAVQTLCARAGTSWDDTKLISLHGRQGSVVQELGRWGKVFALTDGKDAVSRVCGDLCRAGMGDAKIWVGQRLSYPEESIEVGTAESLKDYRCDALSCLLITRPPEPLPLPVGLPDETFQRIAAGERPAVPMTKSEVRAVTLSKLRLTPDAVLWDVGAGTGSVSVEAALLCPEGKVYAVERREDACELIGRNGEKFALENLTVVRGCAPGALEGLPAPTHVFVGGSSGGLGEILRLALSRNPGVRVVINVVSLETLAELAGILGEADFAGAEIVQLSVARGRIAGGHHLMTGMNPVWIASMGGTT